MTASPSSASLKIHPEPSEGLSTKAKTVITTNDPPVDWSQAKNISVTNLAGEKVSMSEICGQGGRRTVMVFLRRFDCPTCYSYLVLFSHLQPILNNTNIKLVFFTCHEDLSEVQHFLRTFAFWLRDMQKKNGNDASTSALPGELYLDPKREAYRFFGLTGQVYKMQLYSSIILGIIKAFWFGRNPPKMPPPKNKKTILNQARILITYDWTMKNPMSSKDNMDSYLQSPGIVVAENETVLYRYMCHDQDDSVPSDPYLAKALQCQIGTHQELDQAVMDGLAHFIEAVKQKNTYGHIPNSELVLRQRLGQGRESEVFKSSWMGITVAVKYFRYNPIDKDEDTMTSFTNEAALLMSIKHPNIISFMGFGSNPPHHFLIMEFMTRGSLFDVLGNSSISLNADRKKTMLLDAANGMMYLHTSKVVHADLKSLNLLVDEKWSVKVADFGIAREIRTNEWGEDENAGENEGMHGGTLQWMAPELLNDDTKEFTTKIDIFAFGVVMWEVATRKRPWKSVPPPQIAQSVRDGLRPAVPAEEWNKPFKQLVEKCWHQKPSSRPEFSRIVKSLQKIKVPSLEV
ncbi:hypothetical protein HDV05_001416 [Chytridiales sp. JEL 0842]|nr:hypothetical protein HDV05_001416 [Chytridiales sp. JEL 0842]